MRHYIFVMIADVPGRSYNQLCPAHQESARENTSTMHRKTFRWSKPRNGSEQSADSSLGR